MSKTKITLAAIAKKAGLSIASVSRVIHTPHLTSHDVQQRVNQAIVEFNFDTKDLFKQRQHISAGKKILVIDNQLMVNSLINNGIEYSAQKNGYKLICLRFLYFSEHEIQQIISYTINHQLTGILIINDSPYLKKLLQFRHALPPLVLVNQFSMRFPCVYFDHLSISYQATQYLISLGHKRIALLLGNKNKTVTDHLKNGYQQALARANIIVIPDLIAYQCVGYPASRYVIKKLMSLAVPPTALICPDNLDLNYVDREQLNNENKFNQLITSESLICGVIDQCRAMNIHIPEQLALVQFIHANNDKQYYPLNHICAMYKPLFNMGEEAMILLMNIIDSPSNIRFAKMIESKLVIRNSNYGIEDNKYK